MGGRTYNSPFGPTRATGTHASLRHNVGRGTHQANKSKAARLCCQHTRTPMPGQPHPTCTSLQTDLLPDLGGRVVVNPCGGHHGGRLRVQRHRLLEPLHRVAGGTRGGGSPRAAVRTAVPRALGGGVRVWRSCAPARAAKKGCSQAHSKADAIPCPPQRMRAHGDNLTTGTSSRAPSTHSNNQHQQQQEAAAGGIIGKQVARFPREPHRQ